MGIPKLRYVFAALLLLAGLAAFQNCGQGSMFHGNGDPYEGQPGNADITLPPDLPSTGLNGNQQSQPFISESNCSVVETSSYLKSVSFGTYKNIDSVRITSRDNISHVYGWDSKTNTQSLNLLFNEVLTIVSVQLSSGTAKVNLKKAGNASTETFICQ